MPITTDIIYYAVTALILIPAYRFILACSVPLLHPQHVEANRSRTIPLLHEHCHDPHSGHCWSPTQQHIILHVSYSSSTHTLPIPLYWLLITDTVFAIGLVIAACSLVEFIVAQTPNRMRGFMVGLWITGFGVATIVNKLIVLPFHYIPPVSPSCGFYYYLLLSLLTMMTLVVFVFLAKRYKLRVREIHVNIQAIAEEHYERYFDQEEEYLKENRMSISSSVNSK